MYGGIDELLNTNQRRSRPGATVRFGSDGWLASRGDPRVLALDHRDRIAEPGQDLPYLRGRCGARSAARHLDLHARPVEKRLTVPERQPGAGGNGHPVEVITD
jgi:hypothetical protein